MAALEFTFEPVIVRPAVSGPLVGEIELGPLEGERGDRVGADLEARMGHSLPAMRRPGRQLDCGMGTAALSAGRLQGRPAALARRQETARRAH